MTLPMGGRFLVSGRPEPSQGSGSAMARGMSQASYGLAVALGFVGVVLGFWAAGRWLDGLLGVAPWIQVIATVAGWVVGVIVVYYAAQRGLD
jgi:F0F1-type ATP synthase assembly protein I